MAKDYKNYLWLAFRSYFITVSVVFTIMSLYLWPQLTPEGTHFGYKTCVDNGYREMGKDICDQFTLDPSYYRPAGEEVYAMLMRIVIGFGLPWVLYYLFKWNKQRRKH